MNFMGFEIDDRDDGNPLPGYKPYIQDVKPLDLGFRLHRHDTLDLNRAQAWLKDLRENHKDIKLIYPDHNHLWVTDPGHSKKDFVEETADGHMYRDGHAWYTLNHSEDIAGPIPPTWGARLPEHRDEDWDDIYPRSCFQGYLREYVEDFPIHVKRPYVEEFVPGDREIFNTEKALWQELIIVLETNSQAVAEFDEGEYPLEECGVYIMNRSVRHRFKNEGNSLLTLFRAKVLTTDVIVYYDMDNEE